MTMPIHIRPRTLLLALLSSGALLFAFTSVLAGSSSYAAGATKPSAHAASSYLTGIGDQQTEMFTNPLWTQLHTKIARYIAPYDAAVRPYSLQLAREWITAAEADHQQVLVAFYHSEYTPTKMPSVAVYQRDVQKFIKLFPHVHQYQPWNEANRGTIVEIVKGKRHIALVSPSAMQSAQYYKAMETVCKGCTIVGPRRARCARGHAHAAIHRSVQARHRALENGDAKHLGPAQLLRHQPPAEHPHESDPGGRAGAGVADRDGRDRAVWQRLPQ